MKQLFKFLLPLFAFTIVLFSSCQKKETTSQRATNVEELKGHSVAVLVGSVQDIQLSQKLDDKDILRLNSGPEMVAAVKQGKAEYASLDEASIINEDLDSHGIEIAFRGKEIEDVAVAFHKESTELCQQFNLFIAQIKADGTYSKIRNRWITHCLDTMKAAKIPQPEGEPIEIGTISWDVPYTFILNNEWAGIEIEMMQLFGQYAGRPVHFIDYDFTGLLAALQTKKIDAIICFLFVTEERKEQVLFSNPYDQSCTVFLAKKGGAVVDKGSFWERVKKGFYKNVIEEDRWKMLLGGLKNTLIISLGALILGTLLGAGLCALRMSKKRFWRAAAKLYIDFMRGIPILVFLMIMFYIVLANAGLPGIVIAIIAFSFNLAAYTSEMFRTGIEGVDKGQWEAGRALGFSQSKTFFLIIVPQAMKHIIPVYKGEAISLVKNTSIVGYIAIQDLTKISDIVRSRTFDAFYPLIIVSILYLLIAWTLGLLLDFFYKKSTKF